MNKNGLEIERRYLIRLPDLERLRSLGDSSHIVQTYLLSENGTARIRKRWNAEGCVYTHTVKQRISSMSRQETEREIDEEEYLGLLSYADPMRRQIEKERICYVYNGFLFEIDIFPFWNDRALMEIELESEDQPFDLPPELIIIREVTEERAYTNSALALSIPMEEL